MFQIRSSGLGILVCAVWGNATMTACSAAVLKLFLQCHGGISPLSDGAEVTDMIVHSRAKYFWRKIQQGNMHGLCGVDQLSFFSGGGPSMIRRTEFSLRCASVGWTVAVVARPKTFL